MNSLLPRDGEPPASGGASQWEDFISGVKQIILTQSSHFASFFKEALILNLSERPPSGTERFNPLKAPPFIKHLSPSSHPQRLQEV